LAACRLDAVGGGDLSPSATLWGEITPTLPPLRGGPLPPPSRGRGYSSVNPTGCRPERQPTPPPKKPCPTHPAPCQRPRHDAPRRSPLLHPCADAARTQKRLVVRSSDRLHPGAVAAWRRRPRRAQRWAHIAIGLCAAQAARAESFAAAWDWALEIGFDRSRAEGFAHLYEPQVRPIVRRGRIVGKWSTPNFALMMSALKARQAALSQDLPHLRRIALRERGKT